MSLEVIRTITIGANGVATETLTGRIFRVLSASGNFTVSIDGGAPIPMAKARGIGSPSAAQFQRLVFQDTSGSANTVQFYVGETEITVEETQTVALDPDSVTAVNPAQQTLTPDFVQVNNASQVFSDCKYLEVANIGGTTIYFNSGAGARPILPGTVKPFNLWRHQDKFAPVTVDATGGGLAEVTTIK